MMRRDLGALAALGAGYAATLVWIVTLQRQFLLLVGIWAALTIAGVLLLRRPALRTLCLVAAAVVTMLVLGEAAATLLLPGRAPEWLEGSCPDRHNGDPYIAGYGPSAPSRDECRHIRDGRVIYDFVYSMDEHRLRATPGNPTGDTILFFGCSFTFGIGVQDDETLPAVLSRDLGLRYNVRNFAFNGYGPHQMLHLLENGLPPGTVSERVRRVFYVAIPDHVQRAAGLEWWGQRAPHYAVGPDGEAVLVDKEFDRPLIPPRGLRHSRLITWAWEVAVGTLQARTGWQLDLYEAILRKSARLVREAYGVPLTVVLWDDGTELSRGVQDRIERLGLETILVSEVLPQDAGAVYAIPDDGHPTALANRLLAARLATLVEN